MKIKKALSWLVRNPMEVIAAVGLTVDILLTAFNGICRYAFRWTWNAAGDITTIAFAWLVFCGGAAVYKRGGHYGLDFVITRLPKHIRRVAKVICRTIILAALMLAAYLSFDLMTRVGGKIMANTRVSYIWYDMSAAVGFTFMVLYEIINDIKAIKEFIREQKLESGKGAQT